MFGVCNTEIDPAKEFILDLAAKCSYGLYRGRGTDNEFSLYTFINKQKNKKEKDPYARELVSYAAKRALDEIKLKDFGSLLYYTDQTQDRKYVLDLFTYYLKNNNKEFWNLLKSSDDFESIDDEFCLVDECLSDLISDEKELFSESPIFETNEDILRLYPTIYDILCEAAENCGEADKLKYSKPIPSMRNNWHKYVDIGPDYRDGFETFEHHKSDNMKEYAHYDSGDEC